MSEILTPEKQYPTDSPEQIQDRIKQEQCAVILNNLDPVVRRVVGPLMRLGGTKREAAFAAAGELEKIV